MPFKLPAIAVLCGALTVLTSCSSGGSGGTDASMDVQGPRPGEGVAMPSQRPARGDGAPAAPVTSTVNGDAEIPSGEGSAGTPQQDAFDSAGTAFVVPRSAVDCAGTLPCRWLSDSGSFAITVTRAANTASRDQLEVLYRVDVLHDTSVLLGNSLEARGALGQRFTPVRQTLDGKSGSGVDLLAGESATGSIVYDQTAAAPSLSYLNLAVIDNGLAHAAEFSALPQGSAGSEIADCALALPCTWTSGGGDVSVTLVAAGGYDVNNRLGVNFQIESASDDQVVLDAGSIAISSDGTPIDALNHRLGERQGIEAISHKIFSGIALDAQVSFYRTAGRPSSLPQLDLSLYRDSPEPRWNPRFRAIPLQ